MSRYGQLYKTPKLTRTSIYMKLLKWFTGKMP